VATPAKRALFAVPVLVVIAIVVLAVTSLTQASDPSARILTNLQAAADRGDPRAKAALDDLKAYAVAHGIDLAVLVSAEVADNRSAGNIALRAQGTAPFWIDVYEQVSFDQSYTLARYVAERRAVALMLAGAGSHQGRLSINGYVPLNRLCDLRDHARARIGDADLDVWYGTQWVSRFGVGPDRADFWAQSCTAIEEQVRAILGQAHAGEAEANLINELRFTVHSATATVPTGSIAGLLSEPDVLLFDPEDDLIAPWSGRASHVRLVAQVDAFTELIQARVAAGEIVDPFVPVDLGNKKEVKP